MPIYYGLILSLALSTPMAPLSCLHSLSTLNKFLETIHSLLLSLIYTLRSYLHTLRMRKPIYSIGILLTLPKTIEEVFLVPNFIFIFIFLGEFLSNANKFFIIDSMSLGLIEEFPKAVRFFESFG